MPLRKNEPVLPRQCKYLLKATLARQASWACLKKGQGNRAGKDSLILGSDVAALDAVLGTSKATSWP